MEELQQNVIKREPDGCYMVTDLSGDLTEADRFVVRMITENRIRSLLIPRLRSFNGRQSLYYEITGLQTLESKCRVSPLSGNEVLGLLSSLQGLTELLPDYFLRAEDMVLSFNRIFTDGREWYYIYRCGQVEQTEQEGAVSVFARDLIGAIDHDDEMAVVYAYQFYKSAGQGQGELRQLLERVLQSEQETSGEEDGPNREAGSNREAEPERVAEAAETKEGSEDIKKKRRDPVAIISFSLLLILGVFLLVWKSLHITPFSPMMLLSGQEGIAGLCFAAVGAGGLVFSLFLQQRLTF